MNTLGGKTLLDIRMEESYSIDLSFNAVTDLEKGALVSLGATGVTLCENGSELPFVVAVGAKKDARATVKTPFIAVLENRVAGSGGVAIGDLVSVVKVGDPAVYKYVKAVLGKYAAGVALSEAAENAVCRIGILRSPFKLFATINGAG